MKMLITALFAICLIPFLIEAAPIQSTDSAIIELMRATHLNEWELAKLAKEKSDNRKVDMYAQHMIRTHAINTDTLRVWAKGKNLRFNPTSKSEQITIRTGALHDRLLGLKGRDFDKAYIDAMVDDQRAIIESLNNELIPTAKDAELEQLLIKTKESVTLQLSEATKIQETLRE